MKKIGFVITLLVILALALSACQAIGNAARQCGE